MPVRRIRRKKAAGGEDDEEYDDGVGIQWAKVSYPASPLMIVSEGRLQIRDAVYLQWCRVAWIAVLAVCHFCLISSLRRNDFTFGGQMREILDELFPPDDAFIERVAEAEINPEFGEKMQADDVTKIMTRMQMFCAHKRGSDEHIPWAWWCDLGRIQVSGADTPVKWDIVNNMQLMSGDRDWRRESDKLAAKICDQQFIGTHIIRGDNPRTVPWGDIAAFRKEVLNGSHLADLFDEFTEHEGFGLKHWLTVTAPPPEPTEPPPEPTDNYQADQKENSASGSSAEEKAEIDAMEHPDVGGENSLGQVASGSRSLKQIISSEASSHSVHKKNVDRSLRSGATLLLQKSNQAFLTPNVSRRVSPVVNGTNAGSLIETNIRRKSSGPKDVFRMPELLVPSALGHSTLPIWCINQDSTQMMEFMLRTNHVFPGMSLKKEQMGPIFDWLKVNSSQQAARDYFWSKVDIDKSSDVTWSEFMEAARRQKDLFIKLGGRTDTVISACRNHHWGLVHLCSPDYIRFTMHIELNNKYLDPETEEEMAIRRGFIRLVIEFKAMDYEKGDKYQPPSGWYQSYLKASIRSFFGEHNWMHLVLGVVVIILFILLLLVDFLYTLILLPVTLWEMLGPNRLLVTDIEVAVVKLRHILDRRGVRGRIVIPFWIVVENLSACAFIFAVAKSVRSALTRDIPQVGPYPTDKCSDMYSDNLMEFLEAQQKHGLQYAQEYFESPDVATPLQVLSYCTIYDDPMSSWIVEAFVELLFSEMEVHAIAQFLWCLRCLHFFAAFKGTIWLGQTVETCINKLLWFLLVISCLVACFASLLWVAYGVHFNQFATMYKSFYTMTMFAVGFPDDAFEDIHMWEQGTSFMVAIYLSLFAILCVTIAMEFFVTIILDAYAQLSGDEDGVQFFKKKVKEHVEDWVKLAKFFFPNLQQNRIAVNRLIDLAGELHTLDNLYEAGGTQETAQQHPNLVVLTGGAVRDGDAFVIATFLQQLFHPGLPKLGLSWPTKVNIVGEPGDPEGLNDLLNSELPKPVRKRVKVFNKSPLSKAGLDKGKCQKATLVYILPSMMVDDLDLEDSFNVSIALSLKGFCSTPFRLMLLRPSSLALATTCGIQRARVCTMNLMKTAVLSQNSRIQGWAALVFQTVNNVQASKEAVDYAKACGIPDTYIESLKNRVWGFSIHESWTGKRFSEFACGAYLAGGTLPICVQINGAVSLFPAHQPIPEHAVVFCIGKTDPTKCIEYKDFVANVDWKDKFLQERLKAAELQATQASSSLPAAAKLRYYSPDDPRPSEETMATMKAKTEQMKQDPQVKFALLVIARGGKIWQQVDSFCKNFSKASPRKGFGKTALAVFLPELPPQPLLDELGCGDRDSRITFLLGQPQRKDHLVDAGIQQCNVLIVFPSLAPSWDPLGDEDTFFLLKQVEAMKLNDRCTAVIELSSGKAGAHMLPNIHKLFREMPRGTEGQVFPGEPEDMEEAFSSWFTAGQAFTPQSIIGMLANTYYCFGLLEVIQALTVDSFSHTFQPEQVLLPTQLRGIQYVEVVKRLLEGSVGPHPVLPLGVLQKTLWSKCILAHPHPSMNVKDDDVLIILADSEWMDWAEQQGLECLAGLPLRA